MEKLFDNLSLSEKFPVKRYSYIPDLTKTETQTESTEAQ